MRTALSLLLMLVSAMPAAGNPAPRVRGSSAHETRLITATLERSPTARLLADAIGSTDLVIYVQLSPDLPPGRAATRFVAATPAGRYLRIVLGIRTHPAERGPLLAHELQHALEIGRAPEVRDDEGVRKLYARIGEDRSARFSFETAAAREIGARVQREIAAAGGGAAAEPSGT